MSVCPWEKNHHLVHIGLQGRKIETANMPPGNLVFLLDVSGSMNSHDNLQAGGSTAGAQGIKLVYKITLDNFIENGNNRVILATDEDFNVGVSSDGELIEFQRQKNIFLTVLGFKTGNLKDAKIEKLADNRKGIF